MLAFESIRDGNAEIYVMNADGSGQTRLTINTSRDDVAAWSPAFSLPLPKPVAIQPPAGMISWWSADGHTTDIVDGNHGILSGDATYSTEGKVGAAFSFDGTGDFVLVPDSPSLNITGDVTVDLWARRTSFGSTNAYMAMKGGVTGQSAGTMAYALYFDHTHRLLGGFKRGDGSFVTLEGPKVTDTGFHHYAYVRSGQTHRLFVDGVPVTANSFTGTPGDTSGLPMAIGALRSDSPSSKFIFHFGGVIDEVEIFNRALSAAEIRAIYNAGSAGKIKPVAVAGDVNGDGKADFIVGARRDDPAGGGLDAGSAYVFSGADGSLLYQVTGDTAGDEFGVSVSIAGDVNGDGRADFIVGAHLGDPVGGGSNAGSAYVFSGADGSILYHRTGDSVEDRFGWSVSGAGDVNGDGRADFIVGATHDDPAGIDSGSAYVFSGADGSLLYQVTGDTSFDFFGYSVSGAGDVNGDGRADFIVGAYLDDPAGGGEAAGSAYVFSGADGSLLYQRTGDTASDQFGWSVAGAGDVNGDGKADFIVGAYKDDPAGGGLDAGSRLRLLRGRRQPPLSEDRRYRERSLRRLRVRGWGRERGWEGRLHRGCVP